MIVGKALKNNKELIDDEKKEIEFSIKYQILSKNTALYAEIINDYNDINKKKLISVNLNDYTREYIPLPFGVYNRLNHINTIIDYKSSKQSFNFRNHIGGVPLLKSNMISHNKPRKLSIKYKEDCLNNEIKEEEEKEEEKISDNKDITKLIISQNSIEGFWEENEET